jgi:hypothetical protein
MFSDSTLNLSQLRASIIENSKRSHRTLSCFRLFHELKQLVYIMVLRSLPKLSLCSLLNHVPSEDVPASRAITNSSVTNSFPVLS